MADSRLIFERDFIREQRRGFTIRKEVLWESGTTTRATNLSANFLEPVSNLPASAPRPRLDTSHR